MPSTPISSMTTLVIPLLFALAVVTAPPVAAEPPGRCTGSFCELVRPAPRAVSPVELGMVDSASAPGHSVPTPCAGFGPAELVPRARESGCAAIGADPFDITPIDPEYCEYVGPAPFFMSPSDSEFCGLLSPAPLRLPNADAGRAW